MKVTVVHQAKGQMQLGLRLRRLKPEDADTLYYALIDRSEIRSVTVLPRTAQLLLRFDPCRPEGPTEVLKFLRGASLEDPELRKLVPAVSGRATNEEYKQKIGTAVMVRITGSIGLLTTGSATYCAATREERNPTPASARIIPIMLWMSGHS